MAVIVHFEKTVEDDQLITYRFGAEEDELKRSCTLDKTNRRPVEDPVKATVLARLALSGINRAYRELGASGPNAEPVTPELRG